MAGVSIEDADLLSAVRTSPMTIKQLALVLVQQDESKLQPAIYRHIRKRLADLRSKKKLYEDFHHRWHPFKATTLTTTPIQPTTATSSPPTITTPIQPTATTSSLPTITTPIQPASIPITTSTPLPSSNSTLVNPPNLSNKWDEKAEEADYAEEDFVGGVVVKPPPLPQTPPYVVTVIDAVSFPDALRIIQTNCICIRRFIFTPDHLLVQPSSAYDVIDVVQDPDPLPLTASFRVLSTLVSFFNQFQQFLPITIINVFSRDPLMKYIPKELPNHNIEIIDQM